MAKYKEGKHKGFSRYLIAQRAVRTLSSEKFADFKHTPARSKALLRITPNRRVSLNLNGASHSEWLKKVQTQYPMELFSS
nr:MAG: hypothetical protein DME96_00770 [Verrucomicrobiota bacterium]